MADLQRLLGTMLATGMAGRSHRGPGFASAMGASRGGGMKNAAGLAALGYLAYKAFQERQANQQGGQQGSQSAGQASTQATGSGPWGQPARTTGGGPSLGERLSSMFSQQKPRESAYPELAMEDRKALLLIRAMIAAANADGIISPDERRTIVSRMDQAGAGPEEHSILERELANPLSVDALLREVSDEETAEQVYMASAIAIEADTPAEQAYLQYLAARLNLPPDRIQSMRGVA